jgi:LPXTG-site transpeptidase (sortase) family protein
MAVAACMADGNPEGCALDTDTVVSVGQTGMLIVTLYEDSNNDVLRQNNEAVLPNSVIIKVYDSNGNEVASLSTTSGVAVFNSLPVGTYKVVKTQSLAGYIDSSPVEDIIQVTAGQTSKVDYGHYKLVDGKKYSLSGYVWHDQDTDRVFDPEESPLARNVVLLDINGTTIKTSKSSVATGYFEFTDLDPGIYSVVETDESPYVFSSTINYKWSVVGPSAMAYMPGNGNLASLGFGTLVSTKAGPALQTTTSTGLLFGDYARPASCTTTSGDPVLDSTAGSYPPSVSASGAYFMQFQVGNQGDADVTNVRVTLALPSNLAINAVNVVYRAYTTPNSDSGYTTSITGNNITLVFNKITRNDVYNVQVSTNVLDGSPSSSTTINATIASYDTKTGDTKCGNVPGNDTGSFNLNVIGATTTLIEPYAPDTGFAPNRVTINPEKPKSFVYQDLDEVRLQIPNLRVDVPIVGIPYTKDWNITWLSNKAGWLEGTSYMGGVGNSVLVGHNYLPSGSKGPFINLSWLKKNDLIYVQQGNQVLVYKVKFVGEVNPDSALIFQHETTSTLTLVTCKDYNEQTDNYNKRIVVRAILAEVRPENASLLDPPHLIKWLKKNLNTATP